MVLENRSLLNLMRDRVCERKKVFALKATPLLHLSSWFCALTQIHLLPKCKFARYGGLSKLRIKSWPPPPTQISWVRIPIWNKISDGNSCQGEPGRIKKNSSRYSFLNFHSLGMENLVSLSRLFLSDPEANEFQFSRLGALGGGKTTPKNFGLSKLRCLSEVAKSGSLSWSLGAVCWVCPAGRAAKQLITFYDPKELQNDSLRTIFRAFEGVDLPKPIAVGTTTHQDLGKQNVGPTFRIASGALWRSIYIFLTTKLPKLEGWPTKSSFVGIVFWSEDRFPSAQATRLNDSQLVGLVLIQCLMNLC